MSNIKNYISQARNSANESYNNFAGFPNQGNGGYNRPNFRNMTAGVTSYKMNADGSGNNAPQSQPYILTISNASATAVSNFDVLGAFTYIGNTGFSNGSLTISGVTISSAISNVNYQQFLYQSMQQPFTVGLTYIEAVTASASQVNTTFVLNTQDANGNQMLRTIVPTIDPYQQQSSIVAVKQLYSIDGFTKLTFSSVLQGSFRIHFYPATNINLASGLDGQQVTQNYGDPNVVPFLNTLRG